MVRKIMHLDLDAFFCSVEELLDPNLKGKAFAVGGRPDKRGVVASCSYAARVHGVRSAMPMARALQLLPTLLIISGRHGLYGEYSDKVMAILHDISPLVEEVSIDEAFIDVTDMAEEPELIARMLQSQIEIRLGLPCSIGVASNKLVAKIANNFGKGAKRGSQAPRAITVVPAGEEAAFLAPLKIQMMWGVGPKSSERLNALGIKTIGDVARMPESELVQLFGKYGAEMHVHARGIDNSPICLEHEVKSISNETTFEYDLVDEAQLMEVLLGLSEKVGSRLRKKGLAGDIIHIKMRYADFSTFTRQTHLSTMTDQDSEIYKAASQLFLSNWKREKAIRLLGVGVSGLDVPAIQLGLFDCDTERERKLLETVDALKERYGKGIIRRASQLKTKK